MREKGGTELKRAFVAISALAVLLVLAFAVSTASALPAVTESGLGCLVQDANGVQYVDSACEYHLVYKLDEAGNIVFVHYQDHGQLPPGAALPTEAVRTTLFVSCGGCVYEGTYEQVLAPSGEYKSRGPF